MEASLANMRVLMLTLAVIASSSAALPDNCKWSDIIPDKVITGRNVDVVPQGDLDQCKLACETTDGCKSVDFVASRGVCSLNKVTADTVKLSYKANYVFTEIKCEAPTDLCRLPKDGGSGFHADTRFFFNLEKCKCLPFTYKGEEGNANNFATEAECQAACTTFAPPDECMESLDVGSCEDSIIQYYYNKETNLCKKFRYTGCGGSRNRFVNRIDCQTKCKRC